MSPVVVGRVAAAARPTAPKPASPANPTQRFRSAATPIPTAASPSRTPIPISRASLSFDPNPRMANSFSHGGDRSMAACPTATIGEDTSPANAAANWAAPSATPAVTKPTRAPAAHRSRPEGGARTPAALRSAALRGSIPVRISDIFAHSVEEGHVGSPGHAVPNRRMSSLA